MRCTKKNQHTNRTKMKIKKLLGLLLACISLCCIIFFSERNSWTSVGNLSGIVLGCILPFLLESFQDISDNTAWKTSQRKLERGKFISDDSIIRISFAYLFRIKIGNKYLLVKNERGTGKYQPVGGVYKFSETEKRELKSLFQVKDDNKISIDESSRNDYRLRMENKFIRKFIKRFDKEADREKARSCKGTEGRGSEETGSRGEKGSREAGGYRRGKGFPGQGIRGDGYEGRDHDYPEAGGS